MVETDREILGRIDERVRSLHAELVGGDGREGRVTQIEKRQEEHGKQIAFWRGAIAVLAILIVAFGGTVLLLLRAAH